jgi:PKD domain/Bacterial Ig-like domain (group 3)
VECYSEFLPTAVYLGTGGNRTINFRLLARDEFSPDAGADHPGGVSWGNMAVTVDTTAGPFLVTSQATNVTQSGPQFVTWNVAGTNTAALAQNVKISLSTDGGQTFPTVLAASTANDGSAPVVLPNVNTTQARIKIEAVDNYFFDINDANFTIQPTAGNVAPLVDAGADATVKVGTPFVSSGSFADENPGTATATVDYGDGAGPQALTLTGSGFSLNHTYATAGTKTVTVKVTDSAALSGTDTATVTVTAAPPTQQASTTAAKAKPKKVTQGHAFKAKVTVTTSPGVATGDVKVFLGSKLLGTGTLKNGKVTIKISTKKAKKLKVGKNKLTAKYLGSATVKASQVDFKIKVVKKK